ncbi:hypothetical protein ACP4OV_031317 [Aristida adscensionis]
MAKRRRLSAAASLPEEIVNEILLLLPARSILRFRAVCRLWAARLSSPAFARAYAAKAAARRRRMSKFVFLAPSPSPEPPSRSTSTAVYSCAQGAAAADRLFAVDRARPDLLRLSTRPCNGLVLLSDTRSGAYWVCNPSTGESRRLPQQRRRRLRHSSAGLALDHRTGECKVVHLFFSDGGGLGCELYTLGLGVPGLRRRRLTRGVELLGINQIKLLKALQAEGAVTRVSPVFADGHLHWLLYPSSNSNSPQLGRDAILCFSVEREAFAFLSAPQGVNMADYTRLEEQLPAVPIHLAELQGSLCLVHDLRHQGHGESCLDVWVLRNRSAGEWSLDYRIAATPLLARSLRFITVLGCRASSTGDDEEKQQQQQQLLIATSQHTVHAYDPCTGDIQTVFSIAGTDIGIQEEAAATLWLGLYEDSLVRIESERPDDGDKQVLSAVTEILLRLPAKSVAQSMLVCKVWCDLIQGDRFTSQMIGRRPRRIFMVTNGAAQFFDFAPLESWREAGPAALVIDTRISDKIICSKPCRGLNLISTRSDDYLCNPCTGAVMCLGIRRKPQLLSPGSSSNSHRQARSNAFTVGRNVGLGFDHATGEHVAVEIGQLRGALVCVAKTSTQDFWTYAGEPPMPVTDMPPAHVDGTLYWMSRPQMPAAAEPHERVVVAFDVSARAFAVLPCEPCRRGHHDAFLVELNGALSLVLANAEEEEMKIWTMNGPGGSWASAYRIRMLGQPDFSLKTEVVLPIDVDTKHGTILLGTGRALGCYDTKAGSLSTVYSLNHLQLPSCNLAVPVLCEESLVRIPDDEMCPQVEQNSRIDPYPCDEEAARDDTPKSIFHKCERTGCRANADFYSRCCRRVVCRECVRRCLEHSDALHEPLQASYRNVITWIRSTGLPMEHPLVPGPDYCYYYSTVDADVARHVFVSLKDLARNNQPRHLVECVYRMDGHVVRETWARKYLEDDEGRPYD